MAGVYLKLFDGRRDPETNLDDWGLDGPTLGPFRSIQTTYMCDISAVTLEGDDSVNFDIVDDLVYYDGIYYGDYSIAPCELAGTEPLEAFDADKARCLKTSTISVPKLMAQRDQLAKALDLVRTAVSLAPEAVATAALAMIDTTLKEVNWRPAAAAGG